MTDQERVDSECAFVSRAMKDIVLMAAVDMGGYRFVSVKDTVDEYVSDPNGGPDIRKIKVVGARLEIAPSEMIAV